MRFLRPVGGLGVVDKLRDNHAVPTQDAPVGGREWAEENGAAFAAQARWHELHPHPLEEILVDPWAASQNGQRIAAPQA